MKTRSFCAACVIAVFCLQGSVFSTPLDDYVALPDANFSWSQVNSQFHLNTFTTSYTLHVTSQSWRDGTEVTPAVWTHWVTVTVPTFSSVNTALILINGGDISDPAPSISDTNPENLQFRNLAIATGSAIVELRGVPNQPLQFADEAFTRSEDEIIAYSWDKFLQGGDDTWPAQLPMVKAAVACMDAIQAFRPGINQFVLAGGSKRGWTAWLTAAVDTRVVAIAPIVSDLLNMQRSFAHHWSCYGFWAEALAPYEELGIFEWFDDPRTEALLAIVDPYAYRDRLTMPKFIVTAAGDDFFVHDSLQFYFDGLLGETYVRTVPNTNHYLDGAFEEVFANMVPYYDAFLRGQTRPAFSWMFHDDGSMTVQTAQTPLAVNLWQADNAIDRDFRRITIGDAWTSSTLTEQSPGVYLADPGVPLTGWRSYFVELVYDYQTSSIGIGDFDYHFTTEMRVLPEVRPFETDLSRDRATDLLDVAILAENWLTATAYYDLMPRRNGDGIINLPELGVFSLHWLRAE
jgi:PhoPQ-activated pathogenicity-related protein